jgi:hypothetical protein
MSLKDSDELFRKRTLLDWIRYSGVSVIFHLNPLHWKVGPWLRDETNQEWPSPKERTWAMGFLFLTIRVWIDDGSW